MNRFIQKMRFEIKVMGINFVIPFIFIIFVMITNITIGNRGLIEANVILTAEIFIPLGAMWLGIFSMKDLVEDEGCEVLFSYPIKRAKFGLSKILKYGCIYIMCVLIYSVIITQIFKELDAISLFLQLAIQSIFMISLGYTSMILVKNSGIAIVIGGTYVAAIGLFALAMSGSSMQNFSIMIYNIYTLPISAVLNLSAKTIAMTLGILLLGYINYSNKLK